MQPLLETHALTIGFRQGRSAPKPLATGLELRANPGEMICLVGPNGVGKSTLLRTLTRLRAPLSGHVLLAGRDLGSYSNHELASLVSVVLTQPTLAGAMRVEDLVGLGRFPYTGLFDRLTDADEQAIHAAMRASDVEFLAGRVVNELSDGERQRVMVARALAQEPRLLVLDEPTAFLDVAGRVSIMRLLVALAHEQGKTVLTSTHDLDLALRSADRVWLMDHQGVILQGSPEDLVLSGQFAHTFEKQNVIFDTKTGSFTLDTIPSRAVALRASGLAWIWTKRALERAGFQVLDAPIPDIPVVEVLGVGSETTWVLHDGNIRSSHTSIYSLLQALKEIPREPQSLRFPNRT